MSMSNENILYGIMRAAKEKEARPTSDNQIRFEMSLAGEYLLITKNTIRVSASSMTEFWSQALAYLEGGDGVAKSRLVCLLKDKGHLLG